MFDVFDTDDLNQKISEIGQEVSENFDFFSIEILGKVSFGLGQFLGQVICRSGLFD